MILFCHGLESGPLGRKTQAMRDAGLEVVAPDCRNRDLRARVDILAEAIERQRPSVVVGSSFGGIAGLLAVAVAKSRGVDIDGLVLCAPALQVPDPPGLGVTRACPAPTVIIHGLRDEVIPIDLSRAFAAQHGARLIEVDDDHGLAASLEPMIEVVRAFERVAGPSS